MDYPTLSKKEFSHPPERAIRGKEHALAPYWSKNSQQRMNPLAPEKWERPKGIKKCLLKKDRQGTCWYKSLNASAAWEIQVN